MENTAIDYKKLYQESLLAISEIEQAFNLKISEKEQAFNQKITEKDDKITQLIFELDKFRRYLFGSKSEKLSSREVDLAQMNLFDLSTPVEQQEQLSEEAVEVAKKKTPKKRAKGTGRMALPEELRREIHVIEPDEDVSGCVKIGEEITEVLDIIPAELYVHRYIRNKYARPNGEGIIMGRLPERVIEKGIPSDKLVAEMVLNKYVYGLPLHRQIDKYRRLGVNIPASTASDWMLKGWKHLIPLWELLKLMVINQKYLQVDESTIKVQDKLNKKKIHTGYMWVYHAPCDRLVLFDYQKGRDQSGPKEMLKDYQGIIQTDGYQVYESLYGNHPHIMLIYCMAHARRKFVDALGYDKAKATEVIERMGQLYTLEQEMRDKGFTWEQRTTERQQKALPVLNEIHQWLQDHSNTVLPKSPLGQAIAYTLPRWSGLCAYAQHGQIEIDNNLIENSIRPLAIGRKNYLFAGSHDAAEMTAAMYSFMATCKKNGVNELQWLTDVLARTQSINHKELHQLLPNNWEKYKLLDKS
jgi:transposase